MGKIIVWNIMSLDGFFEGAEPWDLSMHELVWGPDLEAFSKEQLAQAEAVLYGRKTYEGMAAYWTSENAEDGEITAGMNRLKKLVASSTLQQTVWANTHILGADPVAELKDIKQKSDKPILVFGSADLLATLLPAGVVDEYRLCIAPTLLGAGTTLFKTTGQRIGMKLLNARLSAMEVCC